ncbi:hypothetical protein L2E82_15539 [Cichorium intybus]|uniref:Uncharacterized protein n=1 Tax=Cichorium intybus TaxID=13427 RepID=A0ACB9F2E7_CICIN|nr:hypothetical protein L2E82_15539 [Cichorium intybus]
MEALRGPSPVSSPSLTRTHLPKPIFNLSFTKKTPNSPLPYLTQFTKLEFRNFTAVSPPFSIEPTSPPEEETETVDQDEKFNWFSHWYALMPVILGTIIGIYKPSALTWLETDLFTVGLGFLMLSMGLTLTFEDFKRCLRNPWTVREADIQPLTTPTHLVMQVESLFAKLQSQSLELF